MNAFTQILEKAASQLNFEFESEMVNYMANCLVVKLKSKI